MTRLISFIALSLILIISSCGFKPANYVRNDLGESMEVRLASIVIKKSSGFKSQQLRTKIFDVINPSNIKTEPEYLLTITPHESQRSTFITNLGSSGRMQLDVNIKYSLTEIATTKQVSKGSISSSESYNIDQNRFGNYNAKNFARESVYNSLAEKLRNVIIQDLD